MCGGAGHKRATLKTRIVSFTMTVRGASVPLVPLITLAYRSDGMCLSCVWSVNPACSRPDRRGFRVARLREWPGFRVHLFIRVPTSALFRA